MTSNSSKTKMLPSVKENDEEKEGKLRMNEKENFILNQDKMTQYYPFTPNLSESQLSKLRKAYHVTIPANSHALCVSHACGLKTSISRIDGNFSHLTNKSGRVVL